MGDDKMILFTSFRFPVLPFFGSGSDHPAPLNIAFRLRVGEVHQSTFTGHDPALYFELQTALPLSLHL